MTVIVVLVIIDGVVDVVLVIVVIIVGVGFVTTPPLSTREKAAAKER